MASCAMQNVWRLPSLPSSVCQFFCFVTGLLGGDCSGLLQTLGANGLQLNNRQCLLSSSVTLHFHPSDFSYLSSPLPDSLPASLRSYWWAGINRVVRALICMSFPNCCSSMGHLTSKPGPAVSSKTLTPQSQQSPFTSLTLCPLTLQLCYDDHWTHFHGQTLINEEFLSKLFIHLFVYCFFFYRSLQALSSVCL